VGNTIVLRAVRKRARAGWAQASERLVREGGDTLVWPAFANAEDASQTW
jgi:antitoxin MazE